MGLLLCASPFPMNSYIFLFRGLLDISQTLLQFCAVQIEVLDHLSLREAVSRLAARDPDLAGVVARYGVPPLWARPSLKPSRISTPRLAAGPLMVAM